MAFSRPNTTVPLLCDEMGEEGVMARQGHVDGLVNRFLLRLNFVFLSPHILNSTCVPIPLCFAGNILLHSRELDIIELVELVASH
jgi:hypothetical protein